MDNHIKNKEDAYNYYVSNNERPISKGKRFARFFARYIIPTIYILFAVVFTFICIRCFCIDEITNELSSGRAITMFILCSLIFSNVATVLGGIWFEYISSIEDKNK